MRRFIALVVGLALGYSQKVQALWLTARDVHIDAPLSNIAVEAFSTGQYIGAQLFPTVDVRKQSDRYYTVDKAAWLRIPGSTFRAPKQAPARVEFSVSSDSYYADNHALATENAKEAIANADNPIMLRERSTRFLVDMLMRGKELRIAQQVTSISNIGSGVVLSGTAKWSAYLSSDPVADVTTGHAFIRQNTGLRANTAVMDADTYDIVRRHPVLLDMYKYTQGGMVNDAELMSVFKVNKILVSDSIRNAALENATASLVNIWGNNLLLCHVAPPNGMRTATFGLGFRWLNPDLPAAWAVRVYDDPDPGKKIEITEAGYYEDEKIVARELAYLVGSTL